MSERFFRSNRPGYSHPVSSELENSGIRVAVGDYSVTERRRWRPPYQTGKTVHVHAKHYKHNEDGRMCVRQWFRTAEPLGERRYENWNTHTYTQNFSETVICKEMQFTISLWLYIRLGFSPISFQNGGPVAQWGWCCPTDLAVLSLSPA